MIDTIRRQWTSRLCSASAAVGRTRKVLDGRAPVAKSAVREAKQAGVSVEAAYRWRLSAFQAEILISRAAIRAIDDELGFRRAMRPNAEDPPNKAADQKTLF